MRVMRTWKNSLDYDLKKRVENMKRGYCRRARELAVEGAPQYMYSQSL
jgi:hypothetical protein